MLKTYTLYLRDGRDGRAAFEAVLCTTIAELMGKARDALARHPECETIEVFFGDTRLFEVTRT